MAPSDRDIWTAANEVIKTSDDPLLHAALRYDALLKEGDMAGCRVWRRIEEAFFRGGAPVRLASPASRMVRAKDDLSDRILFPDIHQSEKAS